jgi:hypothetical protein
VHQPSSGPSPRFSTEQSGLVLVLRGHRPRGRRRGLPLTATAGVSLKSARAGRNLGASAELEWMTEPGTHDSKSRSQDPLCFLKDATWRRFLEELEMFTDVPATARKADTSCALGSGQITCSLHRAALSLTVSPARLSTPNHEFVPGFLGFLMPPRYRAFDGRQGTAHRGAPWTEAATQGGADSARVPGAPTSRPSSHRLLCRSGAGQDPAPGL